MKQIIKKFILYDFHLYKMSRTGNPPKQKMDQCVLDGGGRMNEEC